MTAMLVDFRSRLQEAAADLPSRIKILHWGLNETASGRKIIVDDAVVRDLPDHQRANGMTEIALDFEHNTVPGTPAYEESQEPRPVAAYGTVEVVPNDGVWLVITRWTPAGIERGRDIGHSTV